MCALTGSVINVSDAYSDPRFYGAIDDRTGYRTRNLLAVPMRNQEGATVGAFEVLNKHAGEFTQRDEASLLALASHAAAAIETAQLIGELRRNSDQLEQQNANLQREVESRRAGIDGNTMSGSQICGKFLFERHDAGPEDEGGALGYFLHSLQNLFPETFVLNL